MFIKNLLYSIRILSDRMKSFEKNLMQGLKAGEKRIASLLHERFVGMIPPHSFPYISHRVLERLRADS